MTSPSSSPQGSPPQHKSCRLDELQELTPGEVEHLGSYPDLARHPFQAFSSTASPDNDASPTAASNHYRVPNKIASLIMKIDRAPHPVIAALEKVNRWRAALHLTNSDAVGWRQRALADIDRLHQLSLQKKKNIKSINEAYARMTYCMDAHYDCLRRQDRLLFNCNLMNEKIRSLKRDMQLKRNDWPPLDLVAYSRAHGDNTDPASGSQHDNPAIHYPSAQVVIPPYLITEL